MDAVKILGSLLGGGAMTSRQGNNALGGLLGGALGGGGSGGGLGDLLGSVMSGGRAASGGGVGGVPGAALGGGARGGGGIGDLLGAALGGAGGAARGGSSGGIGDLLGSVLGGGGRSSGGGLGGVLGSVAMAAIVKYAAGRMQGSGAGLMPQGATSSGDGFGLDAFDTPDAGAQAELLIEAMIASAKADGRIDEQEEQAILERLGDLEPDERDFVRDKLRAPCDAASLAARVPRDLAEQVYATSLLAIELDEQSEAIYLRDLAQGLGLDARRCNDIHRELGAPALFR